MYVWRCPSRHLFLLLGDSSIQNVLTYTQTQCSNVRNFQFSPMKLQVYTSSSCFCCCCFGFFTASRFLSCTVPKRRLCRLSINFSAAYRTWLLHPSNSCLPQAKQRCFRRENRIYRTTSPVSSTWGCRSRIHSDGPFRPCLPSLQLFFLSPPWAPLRAVGWTRLDRTLTPHSFN